MAKRKRRVFTDEFKADTVRLCQVGDRSIAQVSKDLGVGETALRRWVELAEAEVQVQRSPKLALTTAERDWDNAVAESFFASLKGEALDHETFETRAEATAAIADYVDDFYNVSRLHSSIGYVSPIQFELQSTIKSLRDAA